MAKSVTMPKVPTPGQSTPSAGRADALTSHTRVRAWLIYLLWAVLIIALDQASKAWITGHFSYGQRINMLPFFDFTLLYNTGAAFSFLADGGGAQRWLFTAIALLAAGFILRWLYTQAEQRLLCTALICILGGALGNAIDRLLHGHVVDFLLFYWHNWFFPAFNVADIAITCGAGLLILDEILRARRTR